MNPDRAPPDLAHRLAERVKELTLLHRSARIMQSGAPVGPRLLAELVALIPQAWQFPERCEAYIRWGNLEAHTAGFAETRWMLSASFASGVEEGVVKVAYRTVPQSTHDPFLREERDLIRSYAGMLGACFGRAHAEAKLRESNERLRFFHDLDAAAAGLDDSEQVLRFVVCRLGAHLDVSRCSFAHVDPAGLRYVVPIEYANGCSSAVGASYLTDFSLERLRSASGPVVVRDVLVEFPPEARKAPASRGTRSLIACSLVRQGAVRAILAVQHNTPRDWTANEVALVDETASRMWAMIERREAEARLRRSETMLRISGRVAHLGGFSIDLPELRLAWSDEACAIHDAAAGTSPTLEEALSYCALEHRARTRAAFDACVRDGAPFDVEVEITTAKGRRAWVRLIGEAERDDEGRIMRINGAVQDVTNRRSLEEQLRQAQKLEAIGLLASAVAHDFNNVLSVILSYAGFVIGELEPQHPLRTDVVEIERAGIRGTALTRQLLAFSRQQQLEPTLVQLNDVVAGLGIMLDRLTGAEIAVRTHLDAGLPHVLVDAGQMEQVVMNLVVNARDAMPSGGVARLSTESVRVRGGDAAARQGIPPGDYAVLSVADSGTGMDPETCSRIFEPFFTTKELGRGTGLGLSTVYGIVTQSRGHVRVDSEVGKGTTFRIYLPSAEHEALAGAPRPDAARVPVPSPTLAAPSAAPHVLNVDDDEALLRLTSRLLVRLGYRVTSLSDPRKALAEVRTGQYDALVTDASMSGLGGIELARLARATNAGLVIVVMSGCFRPEDVEAARKLGITSLIPKTEAIDELGRALSRELGLSQQGAGQTAPPPR